MVVLGGEGDLAPPVAVDRHVAGHDVDSASLERWLSLHRGDDPELDLGGVVEDGLRDALAVDGHDLDGMAKVAQAANGVAIGADEGGHRDASGRGHGWDPPRDPEIPVLRCGLDLEERGFHGAVGRLRRAGFDERASGAFQRAIVGHARRPPLTMGSRAAVRATRRPAMA